MKTTAYWIALLTGLLLVFIGLRFLIQPQLAESAFGIQTGIRGNYSFHYIKGIRDLATGLVTLLLLFGKEFRALGWFMLGMAIVPATDLTLVLNDPTHFSSHIYPHLAAILICLSVGAYYLFTVKRPVYAV